jgi:hypothetical protein
MWPPGRGISQSVVSQKKEETMESPAVDSDWTSRTLMAIYGTKAISLLRTAFRLFPLIFG